MMFTTLDEHAIKKFATENPETLRMLMRRDLDSVHDEDNLIAGFPDAQFFLDVVTNVAIVFGGTVAAGKAINSTVDLFKWCRDKLEGKPAVTASKLGTGEKLLVLLFEAYVNRKEGLPAERLAAFTDTSTEQTQEELKRLAAKGVVRQAPSGSWRYVPSS